MTCRIFFFHLSYKLSKEKQVKLLKIDFQKKCKENTFFGCSSRFSIQHCPVDWARFLTVCFFFPSAEALLMVY
jgi:hypothetical protein